MDEESVIQELKRLTKRYERIEIAEADGHEPIPTVERNGLHVSLREMQNSRQGLSADEIKARNELLLELRTSYLPSLEHQLLDLLNSILAVELRDHPNPTPTNLELGKTMQILGQLGHTINQINTFIHAIHILATAFNPSIPPTYLSSNDHEYGGVKCFRAWEWIYKLKELFREHIASLFEHHISFLRICSNHPPPPTSVEPQPRTKTITRARETLIAATGDSSAMIQLVIDWSNRSDFSLLQVDWRRLWSNLDFALKNFPPRFLAIDPPTEDDNTESTEEDLQNLDQHNSASRTDQTPSANDLHHQDLDDPSSTRIPTPDGIPPRQIQLVKAAIPLIKLTRILLNKLTSPTNKPPFTIGTKMSSAELKSIEDLMNSLCHTIQQLVNLVFQFYDHDRERFYDPNWELIVAQMSRIESVSDELLTQFDSSIISLCCYLLPQSDAQIELPLSGNHFKTWFLTLREQFCLAIDRFRGALYQFKNEIHMIS